MEEHKKVKFKVFSSYSHVSAKIKKFCNAQKVFNFTLYVKYMQTFCSTWEGISLKLT